MARPFKFRFVNEIVGSFVLLTLAALILAVLSAGSMQGWLDEQRDFEILLPADTPTGLRKGSVVQIFSTAVGTVRTIRVDESGDMTAEIRIRGDLIRFVREDSQAIVRKKFGVAGDSFIEITRGVGTERPGGDRIEAVLDEDVTSLMLATLRDVSDAAKYTMFQVNQLLAEYTSLARSMEEPISELGFVLLETREIAEGLREGKGSAGRILADETLYEEASGGLHDAREILGRVDDVLANLGETTEGFPDVTREATDVLVQARATLIELERLLQGLQNHWVVRKYIPEDKALLDDLRLLPGALPEAQP